MRGTVAEREPPQAVDLDWLVVAVTERTDVTAVFHCRFLHRQIAP
jgi:hypothetical protein